MKRTRHRKRLRKTKTQKRRNTRRIKRAGNFSRLTRSIAPMARSIVQAPMTRRVGTELAKDLWTRSASEGINRLK